MKLANKTWIVIALLYFCGIIFIISVANLGKLPTEQLSKIPHYDTIGHFVLYGIAAFLIHRAFKRKMVTILNYQISLGILLFSIFTVVEEFIQQLIPNRTFSFVDLGAGFMGIFIFYWVGEFLFPPSKQ
ncbi:MAG: VanZ family protein [Microcoleaceae cyanobacterium MO_207.B10]|nr:VanZ family protein [Microcoleaceae cyanobacterium MO_207.B10]